VDEPVLNYDFTLPEAAAGGGWQEANRYSIWVGKQDPDAVYVGLLVAAILGFGSAILLNWLERVLIPWKPR
jgi:hypothetical protein